MKYAQIRQYDTANGIGIRTTVFFSGCTHNCYNCFNKEYQNFSYGQEFTQKEIDRIIKYLQHEHITGLTILGGEPLQQNTNDMIKFLKQVKKTTNKSIWLYSGYTYEEIIQDINKLNVIKYCDVLVDGRFVERLKNLKLRFRGSSNQRIIDVQKSLTENKVILYEM